eukprot:761351-Hanusia_phi.AAC.6
MPTVSRPMTEFLDSFTTLLAKCLVLLAMIQGLPIECSFSQTSTSAEWNLHNTRNLLSESTIACPLIRSPAVSLPSSLRTHLSVQALGRLQVRDHGPVHQLDGRRGGQ